MNETSGAHDWAKDWEALQRQYWTAWTDLTRSQAGATPDASTPWHEGLEQWARMFAHAGKQSEAAERLMASAKSYLGLMQSMLAFASGKDSANLGMPQWFDALRGGMKLPGFDAASMFGKLPGFDAASMFGKFPGFDPAAFASLPGFDPAAFAVPGFDASTLNNPFARSLREMSSQGMRGLEQLASGASPMLQQMQAEGVSWLKAPAFGYAREHQEHYQKMALALVEFQQALGQYNALMMKASQRSFELLESKVADRSEPGRQIDSIRALYDLWVDAAEEAYAEIALSDEFRTVYGEVVNSQMRVRSQLQQEVERIAVDFGMPSRTELNSVHKRLHELRRELRASQEAQRNPDADGRDAEIAAMRAEIDDLRRLVENSPAPVAAKSTAAGKSPAPAKPRTAAKPGRAKRPRAKGKRAAAKRSHVATKSAAIVTKAKPSVRVLPPSEPAKPVHDKARRSARRAPAAKREAPATAPRHDAKGATGPVSFGDAIAAMRRDLGVRGGRRKASGAAMTRITRVSAPRRRGGNRSTR